jgi:hypothetical protein
MLAMAGALCGTWMGTQGLMPAAAKAQQGVAIKLLTSSMGGGVGSPQALLGSLLAREPAGRTDLPAVCSSATTFFTCSCQRRRRRRAIHSVNLDAHKHG